MTTTFSNALFISDLHLMEDRPECTRAFFRFLEWIPEEIDALFILGDFFEYWVGDDIHLPGSKEISQKLKEASKTKQLKLFFLSGNRDFAIGPKYCEASNMSLIEDGTVFNIADQKVLLSHGDIYCTDDVSYQRYRKIIRNPWVMKFLLMLSPKRRIKIAEKLRAKSKQNFQQNPTYVDVNTTAVENAFNATKADVLIHGHTHLADIHLHDANEKRNAHTRMVLGDWHKVGWYGQIDESGHALKQFDIANPSF